VVCCTAEGLLGFALSEDCVVLHCLSGCGILHSFSGCGVFLSLRGCGVLHCLGAVEWCTV